MSKTFRYDPEAGGAVKKHSDGVRPLDNTPQGWDLANQCIDKAWILSRFAFRVRRVVRSLICDGLIDESEMDEYVMRLNWIMLRHSERYDPTRVGANGRPASPFHFMSILLHGFALNLRDYAMYRKKYFRRVTLVQTKDEAMMTPRSISVQELRLSDGCKNVEKLHFRLDMQTLIEGLSPAGRIFLGMRLRDKSQEETAAKIAELTGRQCDRDRVRKVIEPYVQRVARRLGFYPLSEISKEI